MKKVMTLMKKIIIVTCILVLLFLIISYLKSVSQYHDDNIIDGYLQSEKCRDGAIRDYHKYNVYYYSENDDEKFSYSNNYNLIDENNIDNVKYFFEKMSMIVEYSNCESKYKKFDVDSITVGDYVKIYRPQNYYTELENGCEKNNECRYSNYFVVYFYDIDSHILYMIEDNP